MNLLFNYDTKHQIEIGPGYIHLFKDLTAATSYLDSLSGVLNLAYRCYRDFPFNKNAKTLNEGIKSSLKFFKHSLRWYDKTNLNYNFIVEVDVPKGTEYWEDEVTSKMAVHTVIYK